ncbi:MAG: hypothetical protein BWY57_00002 [Betaproteobacteria bacterium ADurb.Bin341]|nr:MAG: hypothetical protein BWY57_00002 [Betaproteobacteria bacterium ADurb.Bin341]
MHLAQTLTAHSALGPQPIQTLDTKHSAGTPCLDPFADPDLLLFEHFVKARRRQSLVLQQLLLNALIIGKIAIKTH